MGEQDQPVFPTRMARLNAGDVIAERYDVERILGRGGMGEVYLVQDRDTGQRLALKTLLPQYAEHKRAIQRFIREVNVLRQLDHPSIVRTYDAGQSDELLYYTMDYVEGKSVRTWLLKRGRLGVGSTVRILSLLCHALEHAHQYTIHRDLSPDNVMILSDGSIKLLDFGLAKLVDAEAGFTRIGVRLGKYEYSAPEQNLNAAQVDHRADIYSIGVMFYEMLSGQLPRSGQRLTDLVPFLPPECDAFVEKAMARVPEDRFANAREVRSALAQIYDIYTGKAAQAARQRKRPAAALRRWITHFGRRWFRFGKQPVTDPDKRDSRRQ